MRSAVAVLAMIIGAFCVIGGALLAQEQKADSARTAAPATPITAGQEMFHSYCASCHGIDGKGNGSATSALKTKPPDLTQLTKLYGKFPATMVEHVIQGDQFVLAHGPREMPVWGQAFRNMNADPNLAKMKVQNLRIYIESIQQK
jgi:mono/diheme cytochrome c family protein